MLYVEVCVQCVADGEHGAVVATHWLVGLCWWEMGSCHVAATSTHGGPESMRCVIFGDTFDMCVRFMDRPARGFGYTEWLEGFREAVP